MRETQFGELISIDTLSTVSTGSSPSFCSIYLNSPNDLPQYSRAHDILSLRIPVQVDYSIMNDKLRLGVNTFLQTPIYSSYKYGVISVTRVIADDEIICTYNSVEYNQRNGEALNQLIFGMGINARYHLSDRWNIRMSVNKVMRSILYSDGQSRYFQHKSHYLVPIECNLTMGYTIYQAKKLEDPISIIEGS